MKQFARFKNARCGETTPMLLVPVFIILIAFFGFMAVRNEMIKDDMRDAEEAIRIEEKALSKAREEFAGQLSAREVGLAGLTADPDAQLTKRRKEIDAAKLEADAETKRELELGPRRVELERLESERRQELNDLRAEFDELRSQGRVALPSDALQAAQSDPATELFTRAEAESVLVLRRHGLAVTDLQVYPVSMEIQADFLYLRHTANWFQTRVNDYYAKLSALENPDHDKAWAAYQIAKDEHADLRDDRTTLLKNLKSAIDELTEIVNATNRERGALGIERKFVSAYISTLEDERKILRDIECKPPAEPTKRIRVR